MFAFQMGNQAMIPVERENRFLPRYNPIWFTQRFIRN